MQGCYEYDIVHVCVTTDIVSFILQLANTVSNLRDHVIYWYSYTAIA
jgi:hypothetical protein